MRPKIDLQNIFSFHIILKQQTHCSSAPDKMMWMSFHSLNFLGYISNGLLEVMDVCFNLLVIQNPNFVDENCGHKAS